MALAVESVELRPARVVAGSARWPGWTYAATVLVSAFLLFQVQPLVSKAILPWFGGSPAVWTTCMLFFQTVLFAGYAYAHLSEHRLSRTGQMVVHLVLLTTAVLMLPILPDPHWKPDGDDEPTLRILLLLTVTVGLPYFVLSSTGPLLQAWFSRTYPGRSPYRLYALSNFGSLAALLSYPFVFEPALRLGQQAELWSAGFMLFAVLCGCGVMVAWVIARQDWSVADSLRESSAWGGLSSLPSWGGRLESLPHTSRTQRLLWVVLPGFASMMLLATTNHVCQDVAVMPFLWVVPLSLYLLSFIICFDHERWYQCRFFAAATAVLLVLAAALYDLPFETNFWQELTVGFLAMFGVCLLCHGELVRLKPSPRHLTAYYLWISAGGALGGLFVSLIAPVIFDTFVEWRIGLIGGYLLAVILLVRGPWSVVRGFALRSHRTTDPFPAAKWLSGSLALVGLAAILYFQSSSQRTTVVQTRNFYGEVSVIHRAEEDPAEHDLALLSGGIVHGVQFVAEPKRSIPTTYYGTVSGIGRVLTGLQTRPRVRVGAIGLGVGTLAAYTRPGDEYRFYEINPEMLRVAETHFTFLNDARCRVRTILGDARLSLEREPPRRFDVLVLDAFSGDAVPAHLLTKEAFEVYLRHLAEGGLICIHITNIYLDLAPVVRGLAREFGLPVVQVASESNPDLALYEADWMILGRDADQLERLTGVPPESPSPSERAVLWSDDAGNLFEILKSAE